MGADPVVLGLLGDAVERVESATAADIVLWTRDAAARTPIPVGPALNVLDLRGEPPDGRDVPPGVGLLLVSSDASAWSVTAVPIAVVPRPLTPAAEAMATITALHLLLGDRSDLAFAEEAAAWARARGIACGASAPTGARGLALAARFDPAPARGVVTLDLGDDTDQVLSALASGGAVLFRDPSPCRIRLEQAGAARRIEDAAALDDLGADAIGTMSNAALAYVRAHHDGARIGASLQSALHAALASWRRHVARWPERGPGTHVLVISDEALNLVDIRVHLPFAAMLRRGVIAGYTLLRHGDFAFSTAPVTPGLRFGAIWVQRSTDPLVQLLLRCLHKPFVYDLDDLLTVSPSYREPFADESVAVVEALARDCAVLSCATPLLAQRLGHADKAVVTPNLAEGDQSHAPGRARTVVWASSDRPALTAARAEVERAVRDFCRAHRLTLLCIGADPPPAFAGITVEHLGLMSHAAYLGRLRAAAPGILVGPLETGADPETQAFIDAKSDVKVIEARRAGLVGVFSRAAPYAGSDLAPPILCDNDYASWLEGLERARLACEQAQPPTPWPERRGADGLGPMPWAAALQRAATDLAAADVAEALQFIRAQGETLLSTPDRFDEADYLRRHADVREAVADGTMASGYRHYVQSGFREGRAARQLPAAGDAGQLWWSRLLRTLGRVETAVAARETEIEELRDRLALRPALPAPAADADPPPLPAGEIPGPCPVCDAPGPHGEIMVILGHRLGRCRACGSCFYAERTPYLYEDEAEAAVLLQLYLEQNAGTHQQTRLLFALDDVGSVLDVGCGFGFTVDLAGSVLGWRAVGLDPSAMGASGAAALGADIRPTYLTQESNLGGFELVIASEVIEHVPDPYPFLALLRGALGPGGTLVLTTPDAGALATGIGDARTLCITAPRVHLVLFTRESLTLALQRAGFRHVQVASHGDSLLAYASDRAFKFRADADSAHAAAYRTYLETLLERAEPGVPLWNGAAGRLFALLTSAAELATLHALFARITDAWRDRFGIDLARLRLPALLTEAVRRQTTAAALAALQPLNLAGVLLNRARLEWRTPGRTPEQVLAFARPAMLHALQTGRILQAANMIDHDLRETAIRARMLIVDCLAELAPEVETELLRGLAEPSPGALGEWLDPAPDALTARLAPAFAQAVGEDRFDAAARLEPWLRDLDHLAASLAGQPELLLRALFTVGVHRLNAADDPAGALDAFERMAREARRRAGTGRPSPAQDFLRVAKEHMALARRRLDDDRLSHSRSIVGDRI